MGISPILQILLVLLSVCCYGLSVSANDASGLSVDTHLHQCSTSAPQASDCGKEPPNEAGCPVGRAEDVLVPAETVATDTTAQRQLDVLASLREQQQLLKSLLVQQKAAVATLERAVLNLDWQLESALPRSDGGPVQPELHPIPTPQQPPCPQAPLPPPFPQAGEPPPHPAHAPTAQLVPWRGSGGAAQLVVRKAVQWASYFELLSVVRVAHALTALAVLEHPPWAHPAPPDAPGMPAAALGRLVAVGDAGGGVHILEAGGRVVCHVDAHASPVTAIAIHDAEPGVRVIYSGHSDGAVVAHAVMAEGPPEGRGRGRPAVRRLSLAQALATPLDLQASGADGASPPPPPAGGEEGGAGQAGGRGGDEEAVGEGARGGGSGPVDLVEAPEEGGGGGGGGASAVTLLVLLPLPGAARAQQGKGMLLVAGERGGRVRFFAAGVGGPPQEAHLNSSVLGLFPNLGPKRLLFLTARGTKAVSLRLSFGGGGGGGRSGKGSGGGAGVGVGVGVRVEVESVEDLPCHGLHDSYLLAASPPEMGRLRAFGTTAEGELVKVLVETDGDLAECWVGGRDRLPDVVGVAEEEGGGEGGGPAPPSPPSLALLQGYIVVSARGCVTVLNVTRTTRGSLAPRAVFALPLGEVAGALGLAVTDDYAEPLAASSRDGLLLLALPDGHVGIFLSRLVVPVPSDISAKLLGSPLFVVVLIFVGAWQFFRQRAELAQAGPSWWGRGEGPPPAGPPPPGAAPGAEAMRPMMAGYEALMAPVPRPAPRGK